MASTSPEALARKLFTACVGGRPWSRDALVSLAQPEGTAALFRDLVEPLADLFEPTLVDCYVGIFSEVMAQSIPSLNAAEIRKRFQRIRSPRRFHGGKVDRVYVLSRVTLGADIAITSQFLQAACALFPDADIYFVGPRKNYEFFAGNSRIQLLEATYSRNGLLADRLRTGMELAQQLSHPHSLVLDPDSRLSQLGLLPLGEESNYYFFESRSYGYPGTKCLGQLAGDWLNEIFGFYGAMPWINPICTNPVPRAEITFSFGFGDNPAKRVGPDFELEVVRSLRRQGHAVLIDEGGSQLEQDNARRIAHATGAQTYQGSFACFSQAIQSSRLYLGYDSVGQHAAAALGVPVITAFRGWANERMRQRWTPWGQGARHVLPLMMEDSSDSAEQMIALAKELL